MVFGIPSLTVGGGALKFGGGRRGLNVGGGTEVSTVAPKVGICLGIMSPKPGGGVAEPGGAGSSTPGGPSLTDGRGILVGTPSDGMGNMVFPAAAAPTSIGGGGLLKSISTVVGVLRLVVGIGWAASPSEVTILDIEVPTVPPVPIARGGWPAVRTVLITGC